MKEWLEHYFERINSDYENKPMPNQLKIQSVELSSALLLAFDISGGARQGCSTLYSESLKQQGQKI